MIVKINGCVFDWGWGIIKKYNIWNKLGTIIKKEFDSNPFSKKMFLKTKIKSYGDEATHFYEKKIYRIGSNYNFLAVILIDFVLKENEDYYQQV